MQPTTLPTARYRGTAALAVLLLAALVLVWAPLAKATTDRSDALSRLLHEHITDAILHQYSGATRENLNIDLALPAMVSTLEPCTGTPAVDASRDRWLGRIRLSVSCDDDPGWRFNTSGTVDLVLPVAVLRESLPRNHVLRERDIRFEPVNIAQLRQGYFLSADPVTGASLVRNLSRDKVLNNRVIEVPPLVQRGDRVQIIAQGSGFAVQMSGTALADGVHGRQIRVRNNSSERVVRAWVVDRGVVEIPVAGNPVAGGR